MGHNYNNISFCSFFHAQERGKKLNYFLMIRKETNIFFMFRKEAE